MRRPSGCLFATLAVCAFVGGCVGGGGVAASRSSPDPGRVFFALLPHHVPPGPDAASFRFAMVHDVIHERYPRHGPAYYRERERLARERIAVVHPESETAFAETDDVAVAMDRTGRTGEAIAVMRDKFKRQTAIDLSGKDLYSSYANLGEFLVRANLWRMMSGDEEARKRVEEGRDFLKKSIEVNSTAHFGREEWQVVAVNSLLSAGDRPDQLRHCDLIGNRIDLPIEIGRESPRYELNESNQSLFGRPYLYCWVQGLDFGEYPVRNYESLSPEERTRVRKCIFPVGAEDPPEKSSATKVGRRAPFDEPALWIIGEWREGSGPDPHLALCLGEIMLRVGQRYLAWDCFERASRMADRFSPTADGQAFLREHCAARQVVIERSLPRAEAAGLRTRFDAELAFGEAYQREYQAYEGEKLQAGANLNDTQFYDEFHAGQPPIASKVGPEEWYAGSRLGSRTEAGFLAFWAWGPLVGGSVVFLLTLAACLFCRPTTRLRLNEVTPPP
jgi:hypothetical protein